MTDQKVNLESYSNKKVIPHEIRESVLKALSFYPELMNVNIEFKYSDSIRKSVMQAQPRFVSMYGRRKWRSYIIKISQCFNLKGKEIHINEIPYEVMVGWIGHELGHIMDYRTRNNWSLVLFGIGYLTSKSFVISAERVADTYAVEHGLGGYILSTKDFILNQAGMPEDYLNKIKKLYMSPEEIIDLMENKSSTDQ